MTGSTIIAIALNASCLGVIVFAHRQERRIRREWDELQERIKPHIEVLRADLEKTVRERALKREVDGAVPRERQDS